MPAWDDLPAYRAAYRARNPLPPLEVIPPELAERKQWLIWRYEPGETPEKKPRKMPHYADGGRRYGDQGSEKDRSRLVTFAQASAAIGRGDFDGLGIALLPDDGLIGIDLDGMIDADTGEVGDRLQRIVAACASYTEWSPSGTGVHIIVQGTTTTFKSNKVGIEVFCGSQFFTFTGRPFGEPLPVVPIRDEVLTRLRELVRGKPKQAAPADSNPQPARAPITAGGRQRSRAETVALVEEALEHVSPDEYNDWIRVGMACKADLGSAGYIVWDAWSARSPKYAGADDTAKRWESFEPKEVNVGWVFAMAADCGWVAPWEKARSRKASRPAHGRTDAPAPSPAPSSAAAAPTPAAETVSTAGIATAEGADSSAGSSSPPEPPDPPDDDEWFGTLLRKKGDISPCLANAFTLLDRMSEWRGLIAYDEFSERTVFRGALPWAKTGPDGGDWSDHLDTMTAIWLQKALGVEFSANVVGQAVEALARQNRFHPVQEALAALPPWDGIRRNSEWLSDYLGVVRTEYTALVGTFFMRGLVKRVMEPGCKFDYCLVLEGEQGKGKSTAAKILAWHWFGDTDLDLSNKDSLLALPGHLVYEVAEMGSLMKAEERKQKSFLSRQFDEYRPPYGKRLIKVPRQCVFIGTTNEEEYLKDPTGGRRFWPVMCGDDFNLGGLREALEQMLAEALHDFYDGERCWPTPDEQNALFTPEQVKRGMPEPFEDLLPNWVKKQTAPFSLAEAACDGLGLTADKLSPSVCTRVGYALKKLGCTRPEEDRLAADPSRRRLYWSPLMVAAKKAGKPVVVGVDGVAASSIPSEEEEAYAGF